MAGLTETGFEVATLDDIKTEIEGDVRSSYGASFDVSPQEPAGQLIGAMSERFAKLWALGAALYAAMTPDGALGTSLDEVSAITGTTRLSAAPSTVVVTATGTPATVLLEGRVMTVAVTGTRFVTLADATIAAATAWTGSHSYSPGDRVKNASRIYVCTTGGMSAGSGGPTTILDDITDGAVHWRYIGDGTGFVDIDAASESTGPKVAASGTLTGIGSPQVGWSGVKNLLDADLGRDLETDAGLRIRREEELRGNGKAALEAIRSAVLEVSGVVACNVFENVTDTTDGSGVLPHAIECLVRGGDDDAVAAAIFGSVAAGIATCGGTSSTVTDSQGFTHTVSFSRPTQKNIYVIINATVDASLWPSDGDAQVKAAIVAFGDAQKTGKDVVAAAMVAKAFTVVGMLDAAALISAYPTTVPIASTTIAIGLRELAVFDTSRITVNVSFGTP